MATIDSITTDPPLRAVMCEVPEFILQWRKTTGADRRDEMWEGVLHMAPSPNLDHQDLEGELEHWLRLHWMPLAAGKVYNQVNVSIATPWTSNYRVPDLMLLTPEQFHFRRDTYFGGPPTVVVEIHSPGDESYEKLPFYAALGTPEVWIIDRDSKAPEIHLLEGGNYRLLPVDGDGWLRSPTTGVEMRVDNPGRLMLRLNGDEPTRDEIPDRP